MHLMSYNAISSVDPALVTMATKWQTVPVDSGKGFQKYKKCIFYTFSLVKNVKYAIFSYLKEIFCCSCANEQSWLPYQPFLERANVLHANMSILQNSLIVSFALNLF